MPLTAAEQTLESIRQLNKRWKAMAKTDFISTADFADGTDASGERIEAHG
jgi:hypothetical protein